MEAHGPAGTEKIFYEGDGVVTDAQNSGSGELGAATIPLSQSFRLHSDAIGQDFRIDVAMPLAPTPPGTKLPVIYVLDGNVTFPLASAALRGIQFGPFAMPQTLIVGIGYHFEQPQHLALASLLRVRDLTSCPDPMLEVQYAGRGFKTGGAAAFRAFIANDVKPFIASRFNVDENDQCLAGSSLGGLFVLDTLFTAPGAFGRYVAISPAIFWGGGDLFAKEAAYAAANSDLAANLFLGAGGLEEAHDATQAYVSNLYRMEATLRGRNFASLSLERRVLEGETHLSVLPGALTYGVASVFGGYPASHDWGRRQKT
jgi:predicted alpha/beta superfamily hydrolase